MIYGMSQDKYFRAISQGVVLGDGLLKDAWVQYKGEKWYPVIIKDQQSGLSGFEVNFSGKRGKNKEVGREKLILEDLLVKLADGSIPISATIRCKRIGDIQRNARDISHLALSTRLNELVVWLRTNKSGVLSSADLSDSSIEGLGDRRSTEAELKVAPLISEANLAPPILGDAERHSLVTIDAQTSLEADTRTLKTAEREAVVKVRFGQGDFRNALLKEGGEKCWMSGIEGKRLLIASHIKPWSHCENDTGARGCQDNGLLLSALWDAAFDAGLIGFESDWNVVSSSELSESAKAALGLNGGMVLPAEFRTETRREYLAYHLAEVFGRREKIEERKKEML